MAKAVLVMLHYSSFAKLVLCIYLGRDMLTGHKQIHIDNAYKLVLKLGILTNSDRFLSTI